MMRNVLFILFFLAGSPLVFAQIQGENKQKWMEDEEGQDYQTKLKTSDVQTLVLKNGKILEQEKDQLSIKIGKNVRLTWTEVGTSGEGVLDREDLMACELIQIDASKSTVSITLYNGTEKTLSNVKFVQELPKTPGKQAKPSEFEVYWDNKKSKNIERDLYRFWDIKEIRGKESKGDKTKKIPLEIKNPDDVKKEETPNRAWMEEEKSKLFASKVSTSDIVKMQLRDGNKWIEAKKGDLGIKVVNDFKIEAKEKGTRKEKNYTKKGFTNLRAVENIDELRRTLTVVSSSGQKTDLIEVDVENAKIEYYWVDDRIKQVRREFVRFWKLKEIEVNEPPKPKKPKTKKKKSSSKKESEDDEQKELMKRVERTHIFRITLENGEIYEAKAGEIAIYFDDDFEIQGLEDEKERKRSVSSVRSLKSIEELHEKEQTLVTVTPKGTKKTMTQVQITEPEIEIIEKEGKNFTSSVVSFWDIKEFLISSEEDAK